MGLVLIELLLDIDEKFSICVSHEEFLALAAMRTPHDIRSGDIADLILRSPQRCRACGYDLRGHSAPGVCPECGRAFVPLDRTETWKRLRGLLAEVARLKVDDITEDSLLIRDLGLT